MLEQTQFPFSSKTEIGGFVNDNVNTKSSILSTKIIFIVLAVSIIGGFYYLNPKNSGLQKDKPEQ